MIERCAERKRKKEMRAISGFNLKQWDSKRKCWARDRESYIRVQGYAWYRCMLAWLQRLGEIPSVQCRLSFCLCLRTLVTPSTPGWWYSSRFWLPATPLFVSRAWSVDGRIRRLRTCYYPEFAREAMTSILGSSSLKGVKISSFLFSLLLVK
jgi:hypothetical protein